MSAGHVRRATIRLTAAIGAVVLGVLPQVGAASAASPTSTAAAQAAIETPTAVQQASVAPGALTSKAVESFVRAGYRDFLRRSPSSTELRFWGPRIQSGMTSRADFTIELARSPEWLSVVITRFYWDTLHRAPDTAGLQFWIAQARAGMPIAEIAARFYASDEYFRTVGHSDVATWIRALYRALLFRTGEPAGVASWVQLIAQGTPRHVAALGFYQSTETIQVRIQSLYRLLLGRSADATGLANWPAVVRAQGDLVLAASIAGSDEYLARAQSRYPDNGSPAPWVEVVGTGTAASCTSAALAAAVRDGGVVEFDCGSGPVTITLTSTLYTCNTTTCQHLWQGATPVDYLVLDGGGTVTLSGGGTRGIYYANTCEADFGWLSSRCDLESRPRIVFRNLTFANGNAQSAPAGRDDVGGGGAIAMRGGTLVVEDCVFTGNRTVTADSDRGGGAVRVTGMTATATITRSTFTGNQGANGGAVSSLHASLVISDSVFTGNRATGSGASSGQGGNGGAVYFDGTGETVRVTRTSITGNVAPEGGSGIFYVSNSRTGQLTIEGSTITGNTGESFWTSPYHDIFYLGRTARPVVTSSTID
ncbi:DUF4214 domain-containing protein [Actinotalea sp. M2MS4P-6]|uniref:DUF4214 domain-containing protein n=1 Tax=Actinotalea sp. M2MS4P-6 TaxID=2983762 RepID=UPI0021E48AB9|nr:DUF4214 domain-containing protein [Actinotalea sp. M2MS4P-6]MCV2396070.1 DUF4214 domain-containing protein [Actinotalea sp. M2MS4P-6]